MIDWVLQSSGGVEGRLEGENLGRQTVVKVLRTWAWGLAVGAWLSSRAWA